MPPRARVATEPEWVARSSQVAGWQFTAVLAFYSPLRGHTWDVHQHRSTKCGGREPAKGHVVVADAGEAALHPTLFNSGALITSPAARLIAFGRVGLVAGPGAHRNRASRFCCLRCVAVNMQGCGRATCSRAHRGAPSARLAAPYLRCRKLQLDNDIDAIHCGHDHILRVPLPPPPPLPAGW